MQNYVFLMLLKTSILKYCQELMKQDIQNDMKLEIINVD